MEQIRQDPAACVSLPSINLSKSKVVTKRNSHPPSALAGLQRQQALVRLVPVENLEKIEDWTPRPGLRGTQCRAGELNKQYLTSHVNTSVKKTYDTELESA
jgi:hypothetical protein